MANNKCYFFNHKWGKWGDPELKRYVNAMYGYTFSQIEQRKKCEKCGKIKIRIVKN